MTSFILRLVYVDKALRAKDIKITNAKDLFKLSLLKKSFKPATIILFLIRTIGKPVLYKRGCIDHKVLIIL